MKKIWILWWIWPEASAQFYLKLIERIKKSWAIISNRDFPQIIINNINAPEIIGFGNDDIDDYIIWIKELQIHQPEFVYMVCNTIHAYHQKLTEETDATIVNIKNLVDSFLFWLGNRDVCILGTENTIKSWLYSFKEITYISVDSSTQSHIQNAIIKFNSWKDYSFERWVLQKFIYDHQNCFFVCACTEMRDIIWIEQMTNIDYLETMDLFLDDIIAKL